MPNSQQLSQWWKRAQRPRWDRGAGVKWALLLLLAATAAFTVGDAPPAVAASVYNPSTGNLIAVNHITTVAIRAGSG
jgi:hypothetical protein